MCKQNEPLKVIVNMTSDYTIVFSYNLEVHIELFTPLELLDGCWRRVVFVVTQDLKDL